MLTGRKLALRLAFTVLVALAFGVSCRGFFPKPVLSSIAIQPPTPSVEVGQTATLQAWGTYSPDNNRSQITSGVAWTSATPAAVCFVSGSTCVSSFTGGTATAMGVAPGGTSTITASAQGISATATATAFLGTVTNFEVCLGTFSSTSCPTPTADVTQNGGAPTFNAQATFNNNGTNEQLDLTIESTWTVTPTPNPGSITCVSTTSPAVCTVAAQTQQQTYTVTVTYGNSNSATGTIVVGP